MADECLVDSAKAGKMHNFGDQSALLWVCKRRYCHLVVIFTRVVNFSIGIYLPLFHKVFFMATLLPSRRVKDRAAAVSISAVGISVILSIALIMGFLFWVVYPLFVPAQVDLTSQKPLSTMHASKLMVLDEYARNAAFVDDKGKVTYIDTDTHQVKEVLQLPIATGDLITAVAPIHAPARDYAFGTQKGEIVFSRIGYVSRYMDGVTTIKGRLEYPMGQKLDIPASGAAIQLLSVKQDANNQVALWVTADQKLHYVRFSKTNDFLTGEVKLEQQVAEQIDLQVMPQGVYVDTQLSRAYVVFASGEIDFYSLSDEGMQKVQQVKFLAEGASKITASAMLLGDISLMIGFDTGEIWQAFSVKDDKYRETLEHVRSFDAQEHAIVQIQVDHGRKGFYALDASGQMGIYYSTSERNLWLDKVLEPGFNQVLFAPDYHGEHILVSDQNTLTKYRVDNEFPEVSLSSLWGKVWYEGYQEPEYIWQSSSASSDFEPKYSLTPLTFGTFKAAFYALLVAIPIAIMGAIYAAFFMSAELRSFVKPLIELMEATPTVIIGFLAGLWLAPILEGYLPGVFAVLVLLPIILLGFGFMWVNLPKPWRQSLPVGMRVLVMIPVVILAVSLAFGMSTTMEGAFFQGDMRLWLTNNGVDYDQRNAIVIGIAMGFAVIPTIFSISEDAIYSVPKHLVNGSLALGASPWQTMVGVVLPTASPGIFSAVMMGLGRAVGETMIVLMATGNTAIIDPSIFDGFRALSANLAVEMGEAEHNSTHYRVLFLSGLVLLALTFLFNTVAESIRHRMMKKYGSL